MGKDKSLLAKGSAKARLRMQVAGEHGRETTPASLPQQHYSACSLCVNSQLQPPPPPLHIAQRKEPIGGLLHQRLGQGGQSSLAHGRGDRWGLVGLEAEGLRLHSMHQV